MVTRAPGGEDGEARVIVVGAGVVGLAVAAELTRTEQSVVVLERRGRFGLETSSRSSEVVHGGLYYPPGSLKATLCLEGAQMIYERANRLGIPIKKREKLVVATSGSEEALHHLYENARASGARDLELWGASRTRREQPQLGARAAILSPWTGVIDSYELMRSLAAEARELGATLAYKHQLIGLERRRDRWIAIIREPTGELARVSAPVVINAAGLGADMVATMTGLDLDEAGYRVHPCKGDSFSVSPRALRGITRLVYPVPGPHLHGLGVHLTLDVGGAAKLGPDASYLPPGAEPTYAVDELKLGAFLTAGRGILPWLEAGDLAPDGSGIRPKLSGPGEPARDFVICHDVDRGLDGMVNLIGIESPGLTAALAIGREVRRVLERDGLISTSSTG